MRSNTEAFAEETGVFGLNLLRKRVTKTEKLFWIILVAGFTVVTLRDCINVIKTYAEGEALTSVSLSNDESITFHPSPTVWIQMRRSFIQSNNISNETILLILEDTFSNTTRPKTI